MNPDNNPYCVPEVCESVVARLLPVVPKSPPGIGWPVLAVVLYLSAFASLAVGLLAVALVTWVVIFDSMSGVEFLEMMAVSTVYLGFGIAWVLSGFCFWTGRLRFAFFTCLAGIAFPVCYSLIFVF